MFYNLYWNAIAKCFQKSKPIEAKCTKEGFLSFINYSPTKEFLNTQIDKFLKVFKSQDLFSFCVHDRQLEDFEDKFLIYPQIKDLLIYRSKKFNNRTHRYQKDCLTLFIFKVK